jgi:cysteine dioxygenase
MSRTVPFTHVIERLKLLEREPVTTPGVLNLLDGLRVDPASLRGFAQWSDERYMRHLLHRDEIFEVILLCWKPGHRTPVHTHNGQLGWATIAQGALEVVNYSWHGCDSPQNQNVSGIDCLAGGNKVDVRPTESQIAQPGGPVATVTKTQTIHQILCPQDSAEPAASVHIYSKPIDSCVAFDLEHHRCARRTLKYDTVNGAPA